MYKARTNKYNQENLFFDIVNLNQITHPFSLIAVKDTFQEFSNRFLLYYDERWQCRFFFSYHTVEDNEENIRTRLSNELHIDKSCIKTEYKAERIQKKYSLSDGVDKIYAHKVYYAEISRFTDETMQSEFEIDGKKFYWMTIAEMEMDERIREVNSDVVNLIKETIQ